MRVVPASQSSVPTATRCKRSLNIELLGLAAASVVVIFGVALTFAAKVGSPDLAPDGVIPLYALKAPSDLEPALTMFETPHERQFAARALFERASSAGASLDRVGALSDVKVTARTVRADRRLVQLGGRLALRPAAEDVPVLSRQDVVLLKPRLAVRSVSQFSRRISTAVGIFFAAFWIAHLFRRWRRRDDDPMLLPALMLLCGIGLMTMCALRDPIRDTIAAELFAAGAAMGIVLLVAVSEIDFEASRLRRAVLLPLGIACGLAALLLLFGSGPGTSGVKVNLFGVQPVEAIRLLVVFALAAYFGRRLELLRELSEPATAARPWLRLVRVPRWRDLRPVLAGMSMVLLFFFLQKDSDPHSSCRACSSGCSAWRAGVRDWWRSGWRCCSPVSRQRTGRVSRSRCGTA